MSGSETEREAQMREIRRSGDLLAGACLLVFLLLVAGLAYWRIILLSDPYWGPIIFDVERVVGQVIFAIVLIALLLFFCAVPFSDARLQ